MTYQPASASDDPQHVLAATRDLTRRVRREQRGGWFPLVVFAALTFAAIPVYRYGHHHATHCASIQGGGYICTNYSGLALWYWPVGLLIGYVAVGWFYLRRSRQRGLGNLVQPYVAVGALLILLATAWAWWADAHPVFLAESLRLGSSQSAQFFYRLAAPAGAIGLALLLLAWIERSWPLFAVTLAYLIAVIVAVNVHFTHPSPWVLLPRLLIDGGVLLVGGVILFLTQRVATQPTR